MAFDLQTLLESQVIDKLLAVMKAEDTNLRNQIAGLGSRVGQASTWDALPTVDQNGAAVTVGDTAMLTQTDGTHPSGLYAYNGTAWNDKPDLDYDRLDIGAIIESAKATQAEFDAGAVDKLATPAQVVALVAAQAVANAEAYHPKGGVDTLKVLVADADEGTKEAVNASQMQAVFTIAEVQAKYDAL